MAAHGLDGALGAELVDLAATMSGAGPHRVVLITGDAGIGKSRLVAEATAAARQDGAVVLTAGCLPLTASMPHDGRAVEVVLDDEVVEVIGGLGLLGGPTG